MCRTVAVRMMTVKFYVFVTIGELGKRGVIVEISVATTVNFMCIVSPCTRVTVGKRMLKTPSTAEEISQGQLFA